MMPQCAIYTRPFKKFGQAPLFYAHSTSMPIKLAAQLALLFLTLLVAVSARAAPTDALTPDDPAYVPEGNGLLSQMDQVRLSVGRTASDLVRHAISFVGAPYRRGGTNAKTGFDCSGFVSAIYIQTLGQLLPHKASQQAAITEQIDKSDLQPGDLVFFNTMRRAFSHVGIYLGNDEFIHSPRPGSEVRIDSMNLGYWSRRFDGARRVPGAVANAPEAPQDSNAP